MFGLDEFEDYFQLKKSISWGPTWSLLTSLPKILWRKYSGEFLRRERLWLVCEGLLGNVSLASSLKKKTGKTIAVPFCTMKAVHVPQLTWRGHMNHRRDNKQRSPNSLSSSSSHLKDRVSLYSPGWPGTWYVDQASFNFTEIHLPLPPQCWIYRYVPSHLG